MPRKENKNVVVISQKEYEDLQKAKRNAEYLAILDRGYADIAQGKGITKTMEELEAMARKPEPLKHRAGYSRRIDEVNKLWNCA